MDTKSELEDKLFDAYDLYRKMIRENPDCKELQSVSNSIIDLQKQVDGWQSSRTPIRPDVSASDLPGNRFRSFGEQLQAIHRASSIGGKADPRLYEIRASGMTESVAGDGGLN